MRSARLLTSSTALLLLAGCAGSDLNLTAHPTRAQYDISHGWCVFGSPGAETVRGRDPEVGPERLGQYIDTGTRVVLSGTVDQVCRTMGCWLDIRGASGETVRVMNRDHGFFVPRNARGRAVHAIGFVTQRELSVETLRHLAEDAGASATEIAKITEPERTVLFIADAVVLPCGGLEPPAVPAGGSEE
ncbi:MAG: DUF4920 domain-containing protein [Phycisphaerales bacterium]